MRRHSRMAKTTKTIGYSFQESNHDYTLPEFPRPWSAQYLSIQHSLVPMLPLLTSAHASSEHQHPNCYKIYSRLRNSYGVELHHLKADYLLDTYFLMPQIQENL